MTRLIGFAGKWSNFRNETFEKRCRATPRKKRPPKTKTSVFQIKTFQFCVIARSAATRQSLSQRHGIPWRSTGARNKKKFLSQKTWIHCFILLPRSSFQGFVSFRPTIVRFGMTNRFVKDCRVGRKSCALLAMTRLIGFAGKRNNFRNETFESRCGATPRRRFLGSAMSRGRRLAFPVRSIFTQVRNHITLLFEIPGFRGSPKNNGRHECVRHYFLCYYRKQPTAAITLLPRAWACRGAYTWFS